MDGRRRAARGDPAEPAAAQTRARGEPAQAGLEPIDRTSSRRAGSRLACALLALGVAACDGSIEAEPGRPILIALTLEGGGPKARSGRHSLQAIRTFQRLYRRDDWPLRASHAAGAHQLAATAWQLYRTAPAGAVLFGPSGSRPSELFVRAHRDSPRNPDVFLLAQVSASSLLNRHFPTLSTFLASDDYLRGVLPLMQRRLPPPRKVFVAVREGPQLGYYREIADFVAHRIVELGLRAGGEIPIRDAAPRFDDAVLAAHGLQPDDWLVIIDHGPRSDVATGELFERLQKVYTYGRIGDFRHAPTAARPALRRSWQALFWDPRLFHPGHGRFSSCHFVLEYRGEHGVLPDFHAAFVFASLEVVQALAGRNPFADGRDPSDLSAIATLLGPLRWNALGRREQALPIVWHTDAEGAGTLYSLGRPLEKCPGARSLKGVPIVHDALPAG